MQVWPEKDVIIVIFIKSELKFNGNCKVISLGRITAFKLLTHEALGLRAEERERVAEWSR